MRECFGYFTQLAERDLVVLTMHVILHLNEIIKNAVVIKISMCNQMVTSEIRE